MEFFSDLHCTWEVSRVFWPFVVQNGATTSSLSYKIILAHHEKELKSIEFLKGPTRDLL